jgi:glycosyltransferase involved in cell wall biosynthesis
MRIGVFTDSYSPQVNGVVTSIKTFNKYLTKRGHEVVVFTTGGKTDVEMDDVQVHRFRSVTFRPYPDYKIALPFVMRTMRIVETYDLDVIHAHSCFSMGALALYAKRKYGIPVAATFHTMYPDYLHYISERFEKILEKPSWKYLKWFHNQASRTIVPSDATKKVVKEQGFEDPIVIPTPVDPKRRRDTGKTFLNKYRIKRPYALFVGRITKEKGLDILTELDTDFDIVVAGTGPYLEELKEKAPDNVKFIGFVRESLLNQAYSNAAVMIMPSETDTQGLTVLEAMSCGTPVLAKKVGGPKELIKPGINGGFFKDAKDLSKKLEPYPKRLVRKCLRFSKNYSLKTLGRKLENVYIELKEDRG